MCKPKFGFAEAEGAVLAPAPSFLPMLCLLGCWASVGTMLGQHWHNLGLLLSNFTVILWFALVFVGQEFGPYWVYLGPCWATLGHVGPLWAMLAPYWAHVEPFWAILGAVLSM